MGIFKDETGKYSSTRVVLGVFVTLFVMGAFSFATLEDPYLSIMGNVILLCLGSTAARSTIKNARGG
tara:strand:+ start:530 stop:730 length:201 start_codon:yes stop_codon:yes gene_type:complete